MKSIFDPSFRYTTDLRKTFARIRREQRREELQQQQQSAAANSVAMRKVVGFHSR